MKKNIIIITFILFFSALLTIVNYIWVRNNLSHVPPPWDTAFYLYMALNDYDALMNGGILQFLKTFVSQAPNLGPLFPATAVPFLALFGASVDIAYLTNFAYLFILLLSVFLIARRLSGKTAGFLSVFMVATFPAVIAFSRDFLFEFPLAALTAFSYWLFLESESFQKRRETVLFGIFAGLSVLTKTMGTVFFAMPFLYALYLLVHPGGSKSVRMNVLLCILSSVLITSIFYVPNFKEIFGYLVYYGFGKGSQYYSHGLSDMTSLAYWTVYLRSFAGTGISFGYCFIFVISFIAFLFSKNRRFSRDYLFIWLWFVFGYVLLSVPENKGGERYALPLFAPLAILMAVHIAQMSLRPLKYLLTGAAVIAGIVNYTYETSARNCDYNMYSVKGYRLLVPDQIGCRIRLELSIPYDRDWALMPILEYMDLANRQKRNPIRVLLAVDHHLLNSCSLKLYAKLGKLNGSIHSDFAIISVGGEPAQDDALKASINESDFVIAKTGFQGIPFFNRNNDVVKKLLGNRIPLKTFPMSDGSSVLLYSISDSAAR